VSFLDTSQGRFLRQWALAYLRSRSAILQAQSGRESGSGRLCGVARRRWAGKQLCESERKGNDPNPPISLYQTATRKRRGCGRLCGVVQAKKKGGKSESRALLGYRRLASLSKRYGLLSSHHDRTQTEQPTYSALRLRSQATNPTPMPPSKIAEGVGITSTSGLGIGVAAGPGTGSYTAKYSSD